MSKIYTAKAQTAVRRVMDHLRRDNRLRGLISRNSEINLSCLASHETAAYGRAFLKNLLRLERLAVPISKISVPQVLLEPQNREVLRKLGTTEFLFNLIDEKGTLDIGKAGLKIKPLHKGYRDLTPSYRKLEMEDYEAILEKSSVQLARDEELGNLFLFKTILRARIDLYVAGEERSAAKRRGEKPGMTGDLQRIIGFLDHLKDNFPFGTTTERLKIKEDLGIVTMLLGRKNNTAADAKLVWVFEDVEKILSRQAEMRIRMASRSRGMKVKYLGKGAWRVVSTGYRRTGVGLLRKETIDKRVDTAEVLSLIQHVTNGALAEKMLNDRFLAQLEYVKHRLPDFFDKLYEIHLKFTEYDVLAKEKACAQLEAALELVRVGTEQALRLAKEMISLSQKDISQRQEEVLAHAERYQRLYTEVEEDIGRRILADARRVAKELAEPGMLFDPQLIAKLDRRLGALLGTFLKGEMREGWLKRIKSIVYGLKKDLPRIKELVEVKLGVMEAIKQLREYYREEKGAIWKSNASRERKLQQLKELRVAVLSQVSQQIANIGELNAAIQQGLETGAESILFIGMVHVNRYAQVGENQDLFEENGRFLGGMRGDRVMALGVDGEELGVVYKKEAKMMELNFKKL